MTPVISPQRVKSSLSTIEWSPDGDLVTKRHEPIANADNLGPRTVILGITTQDPITGPATSPTN
jgi:hypothetical protein